MRIPSLGPLCNAHHHGHLIVDVLRLDLVPEHSVYPAAVCFWQAKVIIRRLSHSTLAAACPARGDAAQLGDLSLFPLCSLVERYQILFIGHVTTSPL